MLTIGGTNSTGSARTVAVCGAYWISSNSSVRMTTEPGVAATSTPTSNASASTLEGSRGELVMSPANARAPRTRLAPRSCTVVRSATGLVSR